MTYCIDRNNYVKGLQDRLMYWKPPVPHLPPTKKSINSTLKIALIAGSRLYKALRYEADIYLLTPGNWKKVFDYQRPDMVLVESVTESVTGHWSYAQFAKSGTNDLFSELISHCKKRRIPTVYWNTQDVAYLKHFQEIAGLFDHVYCSDLLTLTATGDKHKYLPPAVQPAVYNPFLHTDYSKSYDIPVLFDGISDICRMNNSNKLLLNNVKKYGLKIIDSHSVILNTKMADVGEFAADVLGCTTFTSRILALKYTRQFLMLGDSLKTRHAQEWDAIEIAACRIPIIFSGQLPNDQDKKHVIECRSHEAVLEQLYSFKNDDRYRERAGHLAWRFAVEKNTFSHRLRVIADDIGIKHDWLEYPKASLITPTYRKEYIEKAIDTFYRQSYSNKELIVIVNDDIDCNQFPVAQKYAGSENIKFGSLPIDNFAGNCLNYGNHLASGKYVFRIDDDDFYGDNYILDMMLHMRSVDPEFFGKRAPYILIENDGNLYDRKHDSKFEIIPPERMGSGKSWLAGNTIAGKKKSFMKTPYKDVFGSADTALGYQMSRLNLGSICLLDSFNMAFVRRQDLSSHTWRASIDKLLKHAERLVNGIEDISL